VSAPKRKRMAGKPKSTATSAHEDPSMLPENDISAVSFSNLSLHQLFEQQAADMLERADLDEEQKQSIMLAMSCPCCGAGGPSFSFKLKRSP
jgi:hypothetical protein